MCERRVFFSKVDGLRCEPECVMSEVFRAGRRGAARNSTPRKLNLNTHRGSGELLLSEGYDPPAQSNALLLSDWPLFGDLFLVSLQA